MLSSGFTAQLMVVAAPSLGVRPITNGKNSYLHNTVSQLYSS